LCATLAPLFPYTSLFRSGDVVIGRGANVDIRIDDPSISRRHAILHVGSPCRIEDVGSVNGTRVGARTLRSGESVEIAHGDVVDLDRKSTRLNSSHDQISY